MEKNFVADIETYFKMEHETLDKLDKNELNKALNAILTARDNKKRIYTMGNGGSASTASHFVGDFNKGLSLDREKKFRLQCLNDNTATVMSLANDVCYEDIFYEQMKNFVEAGDVVLAISGSGNSMNVVKAAQYAKEQGATVIGLTGFSGGKLKELSDIKLHVPIDNMQVTEDLHMIFDHLFYYVIVKNNA